MKPMLPTILSAIVLVFSVVRLYAQDESALCQSGIFSYEAVVSDGYELPNLTMLVFKNKNVPQEIISAVPIDLLESSHFNESETDKLPGYVLYPSSKIYKIFDQNGNFFYMAKLGRYGSSSTPETMFYFDQFSPSGVKELSVHIVDVDVKDGAPIIINNLTAPETKYPKFRDNIGAEYILLSGDFRLVAKHYLTRYYNLAAEGEALPAEDFFAALADTSGTWRLTGCRLEQVQ